MFSISHYTSISLFFCIISSLSLVLFIKKAMGSYTNIAVFFSFFSMLYGLSGPINVVWGEGLRPLFSTPYNTDAFLISYAIAKIGLISGFILFYVISNKDRYRANEDGLKIVESYKYKLYPASLILCFMGSLFEIINMFRLGGISVIFKGKATYQSMLSSLTLTLPSSEVIVVAFSLIGLYIGINYKRGVERSRVINKILVFVLCSVPYILIKILLGQRGPLVTLFVCLLIGITYFRPIKRIKPKLIFLCVVFYIFMSFLYANRGIVNLIPNDPKAFMDIAFTKERLINALNPGGNEFGAAFGNYSEFYAKYGHRFDPKLGETYVKGLIVPIPSFVYPGDKPTQITYEFRDEFFISEAERGSIAGTALSSILEAYMNFKNIGVFLVYLMLGYAIQKIERAYKNRSLLFIFLYVSSIPFAITFHRSAFGGIFAGIILRAIVIQVLITLYFGSKKPKVKSVMG